MEVELSGENEHEKFNEDDVTRQMSPPTKTELLATINTVQLKLSPKYKHVSSELEALKKDVTQQWWFSDMNEFKLKLNKIVAELPAIFKLYVFMTTDSIKENKSISFKDVETFLTRQQFPTGISDDAKRRSYGARLHAYLSNLNQNPTYQKQSWSSAQFPAFPKDGGTKRRKRRKRASRKYYF